MFEKELRTQIVKVCHRLSALGLVAATDGNVSARLEHQPGKFLITPSGIAKGEVTEDCIVIFDEAGELVSSKDETQFRVSSEVKVHLAAYRASRKAGAVIHAHPPVASAFSFAGRESLLTRPIVPDVVSLIGPIPTVPYHTPGSRILADVAAPFFENATIVLLAQHGAVALGSDPWRAFLRMEKLEQAAVIIKHALELSETGLIKELTPEEIKDLKKVYKEGRGTKLLRRPDAEKSVHE